MQWVYFALGVSAAFNIIGGIAIYIVLFHKVKFSEQERMDLIDDLERGKI